MKSHPRHYVLHSHSDQAEPCRLRDGQQSVHAQAAVESACHINVVVVQHDICDQIAEPENETTVLTVFAVIVFR